MLKVKGPMEDSSGTKSKAEAHTDPQEHLCIEESEAKPSHKGSKSKDDHKQLRRGRD